MKLLFVFLMIFSLNAYSQNEIGLSLQGNLLIGLDKKIERISSNGNAFYFGHSFKLGKDMFFYTQITYVNTTYILDGLFFKRSQNVFELTPPNYKQSLIKFNSVQIPFFIKGLASGDLSSRHYTTFSLGPILDYTFTIRQKYKIDTKKISEIAEIDNQITSRLGFEINNYKKFKNFKSAINFGIGGSYQLSEYLDNDNKSFKPLTIYFKLGYVI